MREEPLSSPAPSAGASCPKPGTRAYPAAFGPWGERQEPAMVLRVSTGEGWPGGRPSSSIAVVMAMMMETASREASELGATPSSLVLDC